MALPLPVGDDELVTLARRGDEDAFAALYERYFSGVYDFLTRLLRDRQEAADVAQDTFIKAFERLGHLQKPEAFKSWLFTIAHRNGLNRIERSKRAIVVGDFYVSDREASELGVIDADRAGDPERSAEAKAAARIIWEAAAGLDPKTYSVMDLHVRHGLDSSEIAEVLGVSKGNAYTMVSRMKKTFSSTLATYLLVRNGSADCDELARIVAEDTGSGLTPQLRKSAERHAKACDVCRENRKVLFLPLKLFAALGAAPIPAGLQATIWGGVQAAGIGGAAAVKPTGTETSGSQGESTATSPTATPSDGSGVSNTGGGGVGAGGGGVAGWARSNVGGLASAAVLIALLFAGGAALLSGDDGAGDTEVLSAGVTTEAPVITAQQTTVPVETTAPLVTSSTVPATTSSPPTTSGPSTTLTSPVVATTSTTTSSAPPSTTAAPVAFVARADAASLAEDGSVVVNVLANDSGYAPGAAPQIAVQPTHGSARVSGSAIAYAPEADYAGTDRLAYSIRGRDGSTQTAQVTLTVTAVNDAPMVPGPGQLVMAEDGSIHFDPLANAIDVDGDSLTMTGFDNSSEHGGAVTAGSLIYTPAANWSGSDKFAYTVSDGTVEVRVTVVVLVTPVNDAPYGPPPVVEADEDEPATGSILEGWRDVEGDRVFIANPGTHSTDKGGSAAVDSRGTVAYTPAPDFSGVDHFRVVISDGTDSVTVSVRVNVKSANDPPTVSSPSFTVAESLAVGSTVGVVTAGDPDGDTVTFEARSDSVITIEADGKVVLVSPLNFEVADGHRLDARAIDEHGAATDFFIRLVVTDVDEAPTVTAGRFSVASDAPAGTTVGTVTAVDPEGAAVTFGLRNAAGLISIDAQSGVVSLAKDVDITTFPITATVVATDPAGNEGRAVITITVDDVDGPVITNFSSEEDAFYEPPIGGGVCPARPRFATLGADVTDPSGVRGADLVWRIVATGREVTGIAKMTLVDGRYEVDFSAPPGVLWNHKPGTLFAKVVARDDLGNFSESGEISVAVLPCLQD